MAGAAARELLAPVEDVWRFLAEPYHLSDWWPGLRGIEVDRRGFAEGARWRVFTADRSFRLGLRALGASSGRVVPGTLEIVAIEPQARWSWRVVGRDGIRPSTLEVDVRLATSAPGRTQVSVSASGRGVDERLAQAAVGRLYDLVQTAATL